MSSRARRPGRGHTHLTELLTLHLAVILPCGPGGRGPGKAVSHSASVFCWVCVLSPATENDLKRLADGVLANHSPRVCRFAGKNQSCAHLLAFPPRDRDMWTTFSIEWGPSPGLIAGPHTRAEGNGTLAVFAEHLLGTRSLEPCGRDWFL